jgi:hypothetical protein
MAATTRHAPDISDTDLERADLEEAARDLDIDFDDDVDDQTLLERIGVAMGEIDESDLPDASDDEDQDDEDEGDDGPTAEVEDDEDQDDEQDTGDDAPSADADKDTSDDEDAEDAEDAPTADADQDEDGEDEDEDEDRSPVHEEGEYRFEADPREGIEPVLDLEMGPLALDVLGVEVHLRRVHAVLTANPNGRRNVVGKLLAGLVRLIDQGDGEDDEDDEDGGSDDGGSDDGGSDDGLLEKVTSPVRGLARGVKNTMTKD